MSVCNVNFVGYLGRCFSWPDKAISSRGGDLGLPIYRGPEVPLRASFSCKPSVSLGIDLYEVITQCDWMFFSQWALKLAHSISQFQSS